MENVLLFSPLSPLSPKGERAAKPRQGREKSNNKKVMRANYHSPDTTDWRMIIRPYNANITIILIFVMYYVQVLLFGRDTKYQ
ncbi:hypothetical protein D0T57_01025 [Dysgonomonas sp. 511]|nr:hypothetical protein [Dysgonomonas sp. 511]